jgi:hypothetical protein
MNGRDKDKKYTHDQVRVRDIQKNYIVLRQKYIKAVFKYGSDSDEVATALIELATYLLNEIAFLFHVCKKGAEYTDAAILKQALARKLRSEIYSRFKRENIHKLRHPKDIDGGLKTIEDFELSEEEVESLAWFESPSLELIINAMNKK